MSGVRGALVALGVSAALAGCPGATGPARTPSPSPDRPYVVTAIDYHFHDAHPSRPIALGRDIQFNNQGGNVHNVTFEDGSFSRDLQPGERYTLSAEERPREPGEISFRCTYHVDRGMTGVLVIVP